MQGKPPRPRGVIVVTVLAFVFAGLSIEGGTLLLRQSVALVGLSVEGRMILAVVGSILIMEGIVYLPCGVGFLPARGWAWTLGMIITVFSIILHTALIGLSVWQSGTAVILFAFQLNGPYLVISLVILYYLRRSHVKVFFGKTA